jgi:predicted unusual protein kinase regulating ubiquinone biosynthesis (AarF/ABC1/UbiB family)
LIIACDINIANRTVIVESFEPGVPMNHYLKSPHLKKDKRRLASLGLNAYLKMMLNDNFIHADLHPGKDFFHDLLAGFNNYMNPRATSRMN